MKAMARTCLVLVLVLVTLSAYLRLAHSGVGCPDWPDCYGRIGQVQQSSEISSAEDAYGKLVDESGRSMAWATPTHRLVASVLGLLVLALFVVSLKKKRHRIICGLLLGLTAYLAILGIRSGGLHDPAVVMGNLLGGFSMVGLLGWVAFAESTRGEGAPAVSMLAALACLALCVQIFLGGLTSANFAALSCRTLPDCHGGWWPGPALAQALDLGQPHEVTPAGKAVGGAERIAVHRAHRLAALLNLVIAAVAATVAFVVSPRFRMVAGIAFTLVGLEVLVGAWIVTADVPIGLALAHNAIAALALLAWLKLLSLSVPRIEPQDPV